MLNDWESLPSMKLKASEGIDDFMEVIFLRLSVTSLLWLVFHGFCVRSRNQNFAGLCWMADDSMLWTAVSLLIQCLEWDHELQALNPAVLCPIDTRKKRGPFLIVMHIFQPEGVGVVIIYQVLKISLTLKF